MASRFSNQTEGLMPSEPLYTDAEATAEPAERRITRTLAEAS